MSFYTLIGRACALRILAVALASMQLSSAVIAQTQAQQPQTSAPPARQGTAPQPETLDSLRSRITAHITQPRFAPAAWGINILSLDTGKTIFEHNGGKYFSPASNAKLYSVALALDRLNADFRISTSLYANARPDTLGNLKSDLIVYGRGDPTFTARLNGGDYYKALEPLAASLAAAGVRRIEGDLIGDESYFTGPPFGSGWEWDDLQWYYGAEVSALSVNDNAMDLFVKPAERTGIPCRITTGPAISFLRIINRTLTVAKGSESRIAVYRPVGENIVYVSGRLALDDKGYTGSVSVHDPAALFVTLFKEVLARRGIVVTGHTRTRDWKYREVTPIDFAKLVELGSVQSPPVSDIARETLKPSQNLFAQLLLLQVGARLAEQPAPAPGIINSAITNAEPQRPSERSNLTTEQKGIEAMNAFLAEVGVKKGDVILEEGSGLSRKDMITPNATIALLSYMSRHRWAERFRDSLPVAGVDGTLQRRMKETAAAGNVRAKTGTLRYVNTLSGYVTTASGERLAFSILLNNYYNADRTSASRDELDAIAVMLASFTGSIR